jgi:hypothetical protein
MVIDKLTTFLSTEVLESSTRIIIIIVIIIIIIITVLYLRCAVSVIGLVAVDSAHK